jgi:hypothetical protein
MQHPEIDLRDASGEQVNQRMTEGVSEALREHRNARRGVVVWKEGRVVQLPAEEILVPEAEDVISPRV